MVSFQAIGDLPISKVIAMLVVAGIIVLDLLAQNYCKKASLDKERH